MDALGGNGNGSRWYAADNAAITGHPFYQEFSQIEIAAIDVNVLKTTIGGMLPSAEASPIINYLNWVLELCNGVA
tara:strand:- start:473 stop:697 length:225 start_codon:yes stop_codon:yes gene_type:complete